jgi:hypothetical protein
MRLIIIAASSLLFSSVVFVYCKSSQSRKVQSTTSSASETTGRISKIVKLAEAFKATMTVEQLASLQLEYTKKDAIKWSNFPQGATRPGRVGVSVGTFNSTQFSAFKALMSAAMAGDVLNEGYDELEGTLAADDYFGTSLGKTNMFGRSNFFIAFLGTPTNSGLWELQFGGHHFAFANTYNNGQLTGSTPSFRGVEPMSPILAKSRTYQPMDQERTAFLNLLESMTDKEKASAKLTGSYSDILLGPGKDGAFPNTKQGINVKNLDAGKQMLVQKAIALYVRDLDGITADDLMKKYIAGLSETYVAYAGSASMDKNNDYIRIDGPNVWIEYSSQPSRDFPGTTHPHSVWRDRTKDYGGN